MEHLRELRNRLIKAVLGLILGMVIGWLFYTQAFNFIIGPFCRITIQGTSGLSARTRTRSSSTASSTRSS